MPDGLHHQVLEGCTVETKDALIAHVAATHTAVSVGIVEYFERYRRNVYVTPRAFLSFLTTYLETYGQKRDGVAQLASSINIGLEKLAQVIPPLSAADDDGCTHRVRPHSSSTTTDRLSLAQATDGLQRLFGARSSGIRVLRSEGMNFVQGLSVVKKALIRYAMS